MNKFEETITNLVKLSPMERSNNIKKETAACICPDCPTYNDCAKNAQELLFCAHGGSFVCIAREADCLCPGCPVTSDFGLTHDYFCTRGAETTQRWMAGLMGKN